MTLGRTVFTVSTIALILLQWFWHGWLQPNMALVLVFSVPLLIPLPWLFKGSLRAAASLFFLSLIHFMHGVTEAMVMPEYRAIALLETALCLFMYAAMVMWTAARRRTVQSQ